MRNNEGGTKRVWNLAARSNLELLREVDPSMLGASKGKKIPREDDTAKNEPCHLGLFGDVDTR